MAARADAGVINPPQGAEPITKDEISALLLSHQESTIKTLMEKLSAGDTSKSVAGQVANAAKNGATRLSRGKALDERVKLLDPHKGKGLGFARCVRAIALCAKEPARFQTPVHAMEALAKENDAYDGLAQRMHEYNEWHSSLSSAEVKAMGESSLGSGGSWVPDEFSNEFIDVLVPQAVVLQQGLTPLPSNRDTLTIPSLTSTTTASYIGESQAPSLSSPNTGSLQMKNKKLSAAVPLSMDLVRDAAVAADVILRNRLVRDYALKMDLAFIRGNGTAYSPTGIRYLMASANATTQTGTSLSNIITDTEKLIGLVEDSNIPAGNWGWMMSHRVKRGIRQLRDGVGSFVFRDEMKGGQFYGYKFAATNQIPNTLGSGADSEWFFVAWPEVLMAENLAMEVKASTEASYDNGSGTLVSTFSTDQMIIQVIGRHDLALAHNLGAACITNSTIGS